jgi:hypothetical protein
MVFLFVQVVLPPPKYPGPRVPRGGRRSKTAHPHLHPRRFVVATSARSTTSGMWDESPIAVKATGLSRMQNIRDVKLETGVPPLFTCSYSLESELLNTQKEELVRPVEVEVVRSGRPQLNLLTNPYPSVQSVLFCLLALWHLCERDTPGAIYHGKTLRYAYSVRKLPLHLVATPEGVHPRIRVLP